jgi:glycosyltransferase involved in cell wall biosynthesis
VLITTRNRAPRLREVLNSVVTQDVEVEIIVIDDASTDGTPELVRGEFPQAVLVTSSAVVGCPGQRNHGFALARTQIVICLDDDARFSTPHTVGQVVAEFDEDSIGVVTIPYVNVRRETYLRQQAPDDGRWATGAFAGGASAFRRDAFLEVGGYADFREHGEETDLAIRLLERGYLVRLGRADHIVHDEELLAKPPSTFTASSRNHLIGVWRNVPWPYLPARLVVVAVKAVLVGVGRGHARAAVAGVTSALAACARGEVTRSASRRRTYVLWRRLIRKAPVPMSELTPPPGL